MKNWEDKIAVVTGASSGIGAATAKRLAREGLRVLLVARRQDRLEALAQEIRQAGGQAVPLAADLRREADRLRVFQEIAGRFGGIDVLVNNAGLGWYGYGDEMSWKTALEMLQVNIEAVVQFTLGCLHKMRARNAGHIINVGSISGSLPSQGVALYGATKSFLDNFTTALYRELSGTRVHVSVVRAGPGADRVRGGRPAPRQRAARADREDRRDGRKSGRAHLDPDPAPAAGHLRPRLAAGRPVGGAGLRLGHRPGRALVVEEAAGLIAKHDLEMTGSLPNPGRGLNTSRRRYLQLTRRRRPGRRFRPSTHPHGRKNNVFRKELARVD